MDFIKQLMKVPREKIAVALGEERYTYGDLCVAAIAVRSEAGPVPARCLQLVDFPDEVVRLTDVLAYSGTDRVPVILPEGYRGSFPTHIPSDAILAVAEEDTLFFPSFPVWLYDAQPKKNAGPLSGEENLRGTLAALLRGDCVRLGSQDAVENA